MDQDLILCDIREGVATLTLNRPLALNAITPALNLRLQEVLALIEADPGVRVLVLTGAGRAFCAGGDLLALDSLPDESARRAFMEQSGQTALQLFNLGKPVIAMVKGVAAGAGFNLALLCDFTIAAAETRFVQSFSRAGLVADWGGHYLLPRLLGVNKAKELLYLAQEIKADEALHLGLVYRVVPPQELEDSVWQLAKQLSTGPTKAYQGMKQLLHQALEHSLDQVINLETEAQLHCLQSQDFKEGVRAFKEKRLPKFDGG